MKGFSLGKFEILDMKPTEDSVDVAHFLLLYVGRNNLFCRLSRLLYVDELLVKQVELRIEIPTSMLDTNLSNIY